MRLLNVYGRVLQEFADGDVPKYTILSHRWSDDELAFDDERISRSHLRSPAASATAGERKLEGCLQYVKENLPGIEWLWIDSCCIDRSNCEELTQAINSMFKWYRGAEVCLAYLDDVAAHGGLRDLSSSAWFTRGWTLQELIAPETVLFLARDWQLIGYKGPSHYKKPTMLPYMGFCLNSQISAITKIPQHVLYDYNHSNGIGFQDKLQWMAGRRTERAEDTSYSMLGIFGVMMVPAYGEGEKTARIRLLAELSKFEKLQVREPSNFSCGLPCGRDPNFVGRESLVNRLDNRLSAATSSVIALVGISGTGKSCFVQEYSRQLRERSPETSIFWVDGSDQAGSLNGLDQIAKQANIGITQNSYPERIDVVRDWLCDARRGKWLIVFDNIEDPETLIYSHHETTRRHKSYGRKQTLFDSLRACDHGSILCTTRTRTSALQLVDDADIIHVGAMQEHEAMLLFEKMLERETYLAEESHIRDLAAMLDLLPNAVRQIAWHIHHGGNKFSPRRLLQMLQRGESSMIDLLENDAKTFRDDWLVFESLWMTWTSSFEAILQARQSAADVLAWISFCDGRVISKSFLRALARLGGEHSCSNDIHAINAIDQDILLLRDHSMLEAVDSNEFRMHRQVQLAIQSWLNAKGRLGRHRGIYISRLCAALTGEHFERWSVYRDLVPHIKAAVNTPPGNHDASSQWVAMAFNAAWFHLATGNALEAERLAEQLIRAETDGLGVGHVQILSSKGIVALAKKTSGRWQDAEKIEVQIVASSKEELGEEHPLTLTSIANLASTYQNQGRLDEAETLLVDTMETATRVLGREHPSTLMAMANLAVTYQGLGRWHEAEELGLQVMQLSTTVLGEDHPSTLTSMTNLSSTYQSQGRWKEAEKLDWRVLNCNRTVLGLEHVHTLKSLERLAKVMQNQARYREAEDLMTRALSGRVKVHGSKHPDTLTAMDGLAVILRSQGKWNAFEVLNRRALKGLEKALGMKHLDTLTSMFNLASGLRDCGQYEESEELFRQVLENEMELLGPDDARTLMSMGNLASVLRILGQLDEAEKLSYGVLEGRERVFGKDHPLTLTSMSNLGLVLRDQGQYKEAQKLGWRVLDGYENALGRSHRHTLTSIKNLVGLLREQGRYTEAEKMKRRLSRQRLEGLDMAASHRPVRNGTILSSPRARGNVNKSRNMSHK